MGKTMEGGLVRNLRGKCRKCRNERVIVDNDKLHVSLEVYTVVHRQKATHADERALAFYVHLAEPDALHMGRGDTVRFSQLINYLNY